MATNMLNPKKNNQPPSSSGKVYRNYQDFIGSHYISKDDNRTATNTRITGGKFHIPDEKYPEFMQLYHKDILLTNSEEYLTETQRDKDGPIAIDIDLKYKYEVTTKQYQNKHIASLLILYLDELKKIFQFRDKTPFPIYIFEKPNVNRVEEKQITKDGIHIIIGIQADKTTRSILRKRIVEKIQEEWGDLKLENSWEDVFDKGVCEGTTAWQLYGSKKPNHDIYRLTRVYEADYDSTDGEIMHDIVNIKKFDFARDLYKLSVRYTGHPQFFYKADFIPIHDATKTVVVPKRVPVKQINIMKIQNQEELDIAIGRFLESLNPNEYDLREAYELTMILPESYYGDGSYTNWMRVGWALCNISKRLLIVWIAMSAKSSSFQFSSISDLAERWEGFDTNNENGLTKRSLIYWARESVPHLYKQVHENTVDYYLNQSVKNISLSGTNKNDKNIGCGDSDIAKILHHLHKGEYACAGLKADKWYRFSKHRWVEDECGTTLRRNISEGLRQLYRKKGEELSRNVSDNDEGAEPSPSHESLSTKIWEIVVKLSQTVHKDHILKEARELFFDPEIKFLDLLDSNPYLLCCKNGVIDVKERTFRAGRAEDYLSKSTNIEYKKLDRKRDATIIAEIEDFMEKLYPIPDVRKYMWQHFASVLVGVNLNQKLHMYVGGGENGKSALTDLMSQTLGDYYLIAPLSLITQSRQKQGQASPDIVALKGVRYAVMQEPSKDDKINDGAMKELTSGIEPIKGRNLFSTPITFIPQFKIIVCSNNFMKVNTTDHGTWRRLAVVDHVSLFTDNPAKDDPEKPYQFKKDPIIIQRFPIWKEVFLAMLVEIVFETQGRVDQCKFIDDSSLKYREREDHIAQFINEKLVLEPNNQEAKLTKVEVSSEFKIWYENTYGRGGPNIKEVHEYLDKKIGRFKTAVSAWTGARINYNKNKPDIEFDIDDDDVY